MFTVKYSRTGESGPACHREPLEFTHRDQARHAYGASTRPRLGAHSHRWLEWAQCVAPNGSSGCTHRVRSMSLLA